MESTIKEGVETVDTTNYSVKKEEKYSNTLFYIVQMQLGAYNSRK